MPLIAFTAFSAFLFFFVLFAFSTRVCFCFCFFFFFFENPENPKKNGDGVSQMKYFSLIYGRCSRVESNRKTHFFSSFPSTPYNVQRTTYNIQHNGQGNPSSPFNVASNLPSQQKSASSNQMVEMAIHLETCYLGFRPIGGKIPPGHRYPQMLHV